MIDAKKCNGKIKQYEKRIEEINAAIQDLNKTAPLSPRINELNMCLSKYEQMIAEENRRIGK